MSHEHDNDDDKGKACIIGRPTVDTPMSEATGRAILAKLDEINENVMAMMFNAMDAAHQAKIDRMVDGDGEGGAEDHDAGC